MDNYKDSGNKWIKEIPVDWNTMRINDIKDVNTYYPVGDGDHGSISPDDYLDEGIPYIRVQNLTWGNGLDYNGMVYISDKVNNENKKSILKPGDILVAKTGATIGKIAIIPSDVEIANTTSSVGKITVKKDVSVKYVYYCLLSDVGICQMWDKANMKSAQPGFNVDELIKFKIPFPSFQEQIRISNFLDDKILKINSILDNLNKQIEILNDYKKSKITEVVTKGLNSNVEYKESGIEWIGKIPKSWEISKIRYVVKLRQEKALYSKEKDLYIGLENIEGLTGNYIETDSIYEDGIYDIFRKDDILFNKLRPYLLKIMYAKFDGYCTGELVVIKDTSLYKKYLYYYLYSDGFMKIVDSSTYGTKMPRASWDFIKQLPVLVPSYEEQIQIAKYLDKECIKVNEMIEKKKQQIEKLENYKKSFIYEYVTGKKRVKGE